MGGFHLTIDSIEEFAAFVMILRGDDITDDKLQMLTNQLKRSREPLAEAETKNEESV